MFAVLAMAGGAFAGDPAIPSDQAHTPQPCNFTAVCINWDFAVGPQGFTTGTCDPTGGLATWQYGPDFTIPPPPTGPQDYWGTVLGGSYLSDTGEGLISPPFTVAPDCFLMEVMHWYDIENNYDGGNVVVVGDPGNPIVPLGGYDATISTSSFYYAYCVDLELGFTDDTLGLWIVDCWDLSAYMGQTIQVEFDFGSDSSVTYPGWYLAYVKLGTNEPISVNSATWGRVKSLYR
jgi:bacillopeptidase F